MHQNRAQWDEKKEKFSSNSKKKENIIHPTLTPAAAFTSSYTFNSMLLLLFLAMHPNQEEPCQYVELNLKSTLSAHKFRNWTCLSYYTLPLLASVSDPSLGVYVCAVPLPFCSSLARKRGKEFLTQKHCQSVKRLYGGGFYRLYRSVTSAAAAPVMSHVCMCTRVCVCVWEEKTDKNHCSRCAFFGTK